MAEILHGKRPDEKGLFPVSGGICGHGLLSPPYSGGGVLCWMAQAFLTETGVKPVCMVYPACAPDHERTHSHTTMAPCRAAQGHGGKIRKPASGCGAEPHQSGILHSSLRPFLDGIPGGLLPAVPVGGDRPGAAGRPGPGSLLPFLPPPGIRPPHFLLQMRHHDVPVRPALPQVRHAQSQTPRPELDRLFQAAHRHSVHRMEKA